MSFVVTAALAVGLLVVAPLVAHLLRRGRARQVAFPPARLVPAARSVARERARLQDLLLFALRALSILALAVLGATPLVRCSRLALERSGGASVALAIVIDDSLSMRARPKGGTERWARAQKAASELLASTRRGDAVAIVLAGRPARVALSPTTDLEAARRALAELHETDRSTDLVGAVQMARTLLAGLPQRDRQLVVLSDFADEVPAASEPPIWAPVSELAAVAEDCGIVSAERKAKSVSALVACTAGAPMAGRELEALTWDPLAASAREGSVVARAPLAVRAGAQTVIVQAPADREVLGLRLSGKDDLERDDLASVGRESLALEVAVNVDPAAAAVSTGGPSLVEQALSALGGDVAVRPLAVLSDDVDALSRYAALILDDPGGLGPEVRSALATWVGRGGVAAAFLGRRAESVVIGANLEPFAQGALPWEATTVKGLASESVDWLGPEAAGLAELAPRGRVRLLGTEVGGARVTARWADGAPFLFERELGRGLLLTFGLPSSAEDSDFALRPAFLALLDHVVTLAREHNGLRRGSPGVPFRFVASARVEVTGPDGRVLPHELEGAPGARVQAFIPELAGRYRVREGERSDERLVTLEAAEILAAPKTSGAARAPGVVADRRRDVDASPEIARLAALLVALEVGLRAVRHYRRRRSSAALAAS